MKRFALLLASVLALASNSHASSILQPDGPGPWIPQPELQAWYDTYMLYQGGSWKWNYTPANRAQCFYDLRQLALANPPIIIPTPSVGFGGIPMLSNVVVYPPAYLEAKSLLEWQWSIPHAN